MCSHQVKVRLEEYEKVAVTLGFGLDNLELTDHCENRLPIIYFVTPRRFYISHQSRE